MEKKISKIGISQSSDQALDRILAKINEGFTGGRVSKSDLATWIIEYFETNALENNLERIRKDHFEQVAYLESVVREMKLARKNGANEPDLSILLASVTAPSKVGVRKKLPNQPSQKHNAPSSDPV